jgi:hypothetical protein
VASGESERVGTIVVRVWVQHGDRLLRARITSRRDLAVDEEVSVPVVGAGTASAVVHDWLTAFERGDDPVTGP